MNCDQVQQQLSALVDGELDEQVSAAVQAHLAECEECRNDRSALETLDVTFGRLFGDQQAAAQDVGVRVVDSLDTTAASRGRTHRHSQPARRVGGYFVTAALGFLLGALILRPWQTKVSLPSEDSLADRPIDPPMAVDSPTAVAVAKLLHATGDVLYRPSIDEDWVSVSREELPSFGCPSDSCVKTEPGILCELETSSGGRIRMNELSEVALTSKDELELLQGQIWCQAADAAPMRVVARQKSSAAARIDLPMVLTCPTSCMTTSSDTGSRQVVSAAGQVDVTIDGVERTLSPGTFVSLDNADVQIWTSSEDLLSAERWMQPLMAMGGHNNPELVSRVDGLLARVGRAKLSYLYEQDLRNLGEYGALPLIRFVQSDDSRDETTQRLVAMQIISDSAPIWMAPDLIDLLEDDDPQVRVLAAHALERLTGISQGLSEQDWQADRTAWGDGVHAWRNWWNSQRFSCAPPPSGV